MFSKVICTIGIFLLIINGYMGVKAQDNFYVAKNGNDAWSGKLSAPNTEKTDGPFATIKRARNAIREMRPESHAAGPNRSVTVMIHGGTYFLDNTIVFNSKDGSTEEYPITYMAYPGEKPVISGGRKIAS